MQFFLRFLADEWMVEGEKRWRGGYHTIARWYWWCFGGGGGNHRMWPDWENGVIPHATNSRSRQHNFAIGVEITEI